MSWKDDLGELRLLGPDIPAFADAVKRVWDHIQNLEGGRTEWAVLQPVFRGVDVVRGGLGSKEEAEAWLAALEITQDRQDHEHFMKTDGFSSRQKMYVGSRTIGRWAHADS